MRRRNFSFLVLLTTSLSISAGTWSQPGQYVSAAGNAEQKVLTSSGSSKSASQEKWTAASLDLTTVTSSANTTATLKQVPTTYNLPDGAQPDAATVKADATAALDLNDYTFTASTANVTLTGVSTPNTGTDKSEIWKFVGADDVKLSATNLGDECITEFNNQYVTAGNGNPSLSVYQYYYTNSDGDEVGPRYIEDYWADGCNSAPLKGCYYKFDVNAPGKLVIGFCLNSNLTNNPLYIIDAATYTRIPSSAVTIQGFRQQYSYETNQGGTTKLTQFTLNDNGLIVIPDGLGTATNLNLYGYITLNLEAASSFYLMSPQSQMGIYGFEFTSNNATTSGECGDGVTWSKTGTELTISFTSGTTGDDAGKMKDYSKENIAPWGTDITKVIIEEGVTSIGQAAFYQCRSLTTITIPKGVTSIGGNAFDGCSGLTEVTIPSSVTSIRFNAFYGCSSLTAVTIPSSVTSIGGNAFGYCSSLTEVTIPSSVTSIGVNAFRDCSSLTEVTIGSSVTSIGDYAFLDSPSLTTVIVEAESAALGGAVFMYWDEDKDNFAILPNLTIYVPASKVDAYQAAKNWSAYADKIQAYVPPTYTAEIAEGTDDADKWTIDPAEAKTTGVTAGTALTVTYSGTREVKSVKAVKKMVNLSMVTANLELKDGDIITGTLDGETQPYKITIADGATVTLKGATINGANFFEFQWAGLNCAGDATIILADGSENTMKGFNANYPGIFVPENKTLTIKGDGKLSASSNGNGCGIGGGSNLSCGNIVIEGGIIEATGGIGGAGIGTGYQASCGTITISGGEVTATGGNYAAGIGSGYYSSCGDITISGGEVTAQGGKYAAGIGAGKGGSCTSVTISGEDTKVTAKMGEDASYSIEAGKVTIGSTDIGDISDETYVYPKLGPV